MDIYTTEKRSELMSQVRGKNTKPEQFVRRILHRLGFRFRLHRKDLPGRPDIVLPKHHKVIFVHGCFWHRHEGCKKSTTPATNEAFWHTKFQQNVERDQRNQSELHALGWGVLVIWECEAGNVELLMDRLCEFLGQAE